MFLVFVFLFFENFRNALIIAVVAHQMKWSSCLVATTLYLALPQS